MRRILCLLFSLCFLLAGCNSNIDEIPAHELYQYSGEVISLVNQHGKEIEPYKIKINFTLGLRNFIPTESIFETYNNVYQEDSEERFIEITMNTTIYEVEGNKKTLIDALDLTNGRKVEFWVRPHPKSSSFVEAIEINLMKEQ